MAVQVGDRIRAIDVLGMRHGDRGRVIGIQPEPLRGNRLLIMISPDRERPWYASARPGKNQWQNLSR